MKGRTVAFLFLVAMVSVMPLSADILYSGPENIVLQAAPNATLAAAVQLAGIPASWDTLSFVIGVGAGGITVFPGAEVDLASTANIFPQISRFNFGDSYPSNPLFGSGGLILFGSGFAGDGDFYSATEFGTFGGGPNYSGWIHLNIQGSTSLAPKLTIIDWAYSNIVGDRISMGAVSESTIPEPSTLWSTVLVLVLAVLGKLIWRRSPS
jgi:hypothetical protein